MASLIELFKFAIIKTEAIYFIKKCHLVLRTFAVSFIWGAIIVNYKYKYSKSYLLTLTLDSVYKTAVSQVLSFIAWNSLLLLKEVEGERMMPSLHALCTVFTNIYWSPLLTTTQFVAAYLQVLLLPMLVVYVLKDLQIAIKWGWQALGWQKGCRQKNNVTWHDSVEDTEQSRMTPTPSLPDNTSAGRRSRSSSPRVNIHFRTRSGTIFRTVSARVPAPQS